MVGTSTFRERRHAAAVREIKDVALRHYAAGGADGLALRGIAREMGISAQALYHYFPSRDELLTSLIADGYHAAADAVAAGRDGAGDDRRSRMLGAAHGYRGWAVGRPYEFRLVYGDAVRDYSAPEDGPTARLGLRVGDEFARACFPDWSAPAFAALAERLGGPVDLVPDDPYGWDVVPVVVRTRLAEWWAQLHGLVALEVRGHLGWTGAEPAAVFDGAARRLADRIGRL